MTKQERFNSTIFIRDENGIYEMPYIDLLEQAAERTTTPFGIGPKAHIRNNCEVWSWGHMGQFPRMIHSFGEYDCAPEMQAELTQEALLEIHEHDLSRWEDAPDWYWSREEAEAALCAVSSENNP